MASERLPSSSTLASAWCNRLEQFCTQLQRSCSSLHAIVQRKPEPESRELLEYAVRSLVANSMRRIRKRFLKVVDIIIPGDNFDIFLEDLNDDVSSALAELQHLEERTTDTLSFEELLVHCDALFKSNDDGISKLELQLQQYGYTPVEAPKQIHAEVMHVPTQLEIETDSQHPDEAISPPRSGAALSSLNDASVITPKAHSYETRAIKTDADYSPLFGDLGDLGSLESLGISATSLTALASQDEPAEGTGSVHPLQHKLFVEPPTREDARISLRDAEMEDNLKTKYSSERTSETEIKHPSHPSFPRAKFNSTSGNDERHLGPVVNKPVSEYGNGAANSTPTTTVSKKDETVQILGFKEVAFLNELASVQYDNFPIWLKSQISLQELNNAVSKLNELIRQRSIGGQHANQFILDQDDIKALGLGSKAKAGLILLVKADKLVTQNTNGVITYRICV